VLAYELLVGKPPFEVKDEMETRKRIMYETTLTLPPHVSPEAMNFIKVGTDVGLHLWRVSAVNGTSCRALLVMPQFVPLQRLLPQTALAKNAGMRPAAADLVHHAWLRPYLLAMAAASGQLDAATLRSVGGPAGVNEEQTCMPCIALLL
jgi:serine/threonine protein kinase